MQHRLGADENVRRGLSPADILIGRSRDLLHRTVRRSLELLAQPGDAGAQVGERRAAALLAHRRTLRAAAAAVADGRRRPVRPPRRSVSHRTRARQFRQASTRARPVMLLTHTTRSRGVTQAVDQRRRDERALPGVLVGAVDHGDPRPAGTFASRLGVDDAVLPRRVDHRGQRRHRRHQHEPGLRLAGIVRAPRRGRATSAHVPPAAPRRARRATTAAASPAHGAHAAERDPITTSTPALARAQSCGTTATVTPARDSADREERHLGLRRGDGEDRPAPARGEPHRRQQRPASASARGGSRSTPPPPSSSAVVAGDVGPTVPRTVRDVERQPDRRRGRATP